MSGEDFIASRLLGDVLRARGLERVDGRPLYAYRCSSDQFQRIAVFLRRNLTGATLERRIAALFCLYGAEWFQRHYQGGPWRWEDMLASLGLDRHFPVREWTDRGLGWWERSVRKQTNSLFLISLVLEGGLPLQVVRSGKGWLADYLHHVLADLGPFGANHHIARQFAEQHSRRVPRTFRQVELMDLAADLLCTILSLREQLPESFGTADPVVWLDARMPAWRDRVAFDLEDDVARRLMGGLIRQTAALRQTARQSGTLVRRFLSWEDGQWQWRAEFTMPSELPLDMLPASATASLDGFARARLFSRTGIGELRPIALIRRSEAAWIVDSLSGSRGDFPAPWFQPVELTFHIDGVEVDRFIPAGGGALEDTFWVFEGDDGEEGMPSRLEYLASGSVRSKTSVLYLVLPQESRWQTDGAPTFVAPLPDGSRLFEVRNVVRLTDGDGTLSAVLTPAALDERRARLIAGGPEAKWSEGNAQAYLGLPQLAVQDLGGSLSAVSQQDLRWRSADQPWHQFPVQSYGLVEVALVRENILADQIRFVHLPADLTARISPESRLGGKLVMTGLASARVLVEPLGLVVDAQGGDSDEQSVIFHAGDRPPSHVAVRLHWSPEAAVRFTLPFPIKGGGFIDATGRWLTPSARLSIGQLNGLRARSGSQGQESLVFGWLVCRSGNKAAISKRFRGELDMAELRPGLMRLLSASAEPDAEIRLTVKTSGAESAHISVCRFDIATEIAGRSVVVDLHPNQGADIRMFRLKLDDFGPADELARSDNSGKPSWVVHTPDEEGPWLAYGTFAGSYRIRPQVFPANGTVSNDTPSLAAAARHRFYDERQELIRIRLSDISRDIRSPEWALAEAALDAVHGRMPLATLDVLANLPLVPFALATLLARAVGSSVQLILDMDRELYFSWNLVPLQAFIQAFGAQFTSLVGTLEAGGLDGDDAQRMAGTLVEGVLGRIADHRPILYGTVNLTRRSLGLPYELPPEPAIRALLTDYHTNLLRRKGDRQDWPVLTDHMAEIGPFPRILEPSLPAHATVLDVPFAAAAIAVAGGPHPKHFLDAVHSVRTFDEEWFDDAYPLAIALISQQQATAAA